MTSGSIRNALEFFVLFCDSSLRDIMCKHMCCVDVAVHLWQQKSNFKRFQFIAVLGLSYQSNARTDQLFQMT